MMINPSGVAKFGNMTSGGGLGAIFDGAKSTGYAQTPIGYAGLALGNAKRISGVEIDSPSNGFDASGLTTEVTIQIYGKNSSMPTSPDDGVLLGSMSFSDLNIERTVSLPSNDSISAYQFVWVRINTGVWAVASEIRFFEDTSEIPDIEPVGPGTEVFMKSCDQSVPLQYMSTEIPQFRIRFRLSERRNVLIDLHADVEHVGQGDEVNFVSGYSFRICRRQSVDIAGLGSSPLLTIDNAVGGGNVSEKNPQHYGNKTITTAVTLEAGYHEIDVMGSGHTYLTTTNLLRVLAENGKGLNCLRVVVLP